MHRTIHTVEQEQRKSKNLKKSQVKMKDWPMLNNISLFNCEYLKDMSPYLKY